MIPVKSSPGRVAGKVAVVTGGSGDLGSAVIRLLVEHGATVANLDRELPRESWPSSAVLDCPVDLTSGDEIARAVAEITDRIGPPDVLVNAAGVLGRPAASHESTEAEFQEIFDINVKGTWLMTKHVVPMMIDRGRGSIVNFSSIHGLTGGPNVPLYHASKGAVRLLSKSDAIVYGDYGIRVNSIHPGSMDTRMSRHSAHNSPVGAEEYYRRLVSGNPIARQGTPEEIAFGVLYLASDESSFATGTELVIDGGYTAH